MDADSATCMPARTEPVMEAIAGVGCSTISAAGLAVAADDVEDALWAGSAPMISAISTVEAGVVSDGLRTTVLPAASAGANFQTAIIIG